MTAKRKASGKRPAAKPARAVNHPRATGYGSRATNRIPAELGKGPKRGDVGYGRPPVEHQFPPGVSGNPAGTPAARANLWRHICKFLEAGEDEARRVQQDKSESLARRIAAKQALQLLKKGLGGVALQATMRMWDRDEGRPVAHVVMESAEVLSPEECEEIRQAMKIHHK